MKKRKDGKKMVVNKEVKNHMPYDENQGFGKWLLSSEGVACMTLFVITNTIVMFMTMSWPHFAEVMDFIHYHFIE
jgi:hypothetical protein